jgi:hypothetical protein
MALVLHVGHFLDMFQKPLPRPYQDGKFIVLMSNWRVLGVIEGAESEYDIDLTCLTFLGHVSETLTMMGKLMSILGFLEVIDGAESKSDIGLRCSTCFIYPYHGLNKMEKNFASIYHLGVSVIETMIGGWLNALHESIAIGEIAWFRKR